MKIKYKSQLGITLVELMVAMGLSLVVLAGVLQLFVSSNQTYRSIDGVSRLQENARFAMFFIARDIRNADYWGCTPAISDVTDNPYSDGILGADDVSVSGLVDSDTITLAGAYGNGASITSINVSTPTAPVVNVNDGSEFSSGDVVLIGNCESAMIATISSKSSDALTMNKRLIREYSTDAVVYKIVAKRYSLAAGSNGPSLFLETDLNGDGDFGDTGEGQQELVEGIENLQILFGVDSNDDTVPDGYVNAATATLSMDQVVSIRVTLTARSLEDNIAFNSRTYDTATDRRFVKNFSSTVAIRNRLK